MPGGGNLSRVSLRTYAAFFMRNDAGEYSARGVQGVCITLRKSLKTKGTVERSRKRCRFDATPQHSHKKHPCKKTLHGCRTVGILYDMLKNKRKRAGLTEALVLAGVCAPFTVALLALVVFLIYAGASHA